MKKLILIALVGLSSWNYHTKSGVAQQPVAPLSEITNGYSEPYRPPVQSFTCDGRQHCSQMTSREEAEYFLRNCPNTKMDGDHDGIPCERQFGY